MGGLAYDSEKELLSSKKKKSNRKKLSQVPKKDLHPKRTVNCYIPGSQNIY